MTNPNSRFQSVWRVMADGNWHTLRDISWKSGYPEASVSAQLRDFRKKNYGGHRVEKRHSETPTHGNETHTQEYRLVPNRVAYDADTEMYVYRGSA